jgi:hypothetical protein
MMPKMAIDNNELEGLMDKAGLGERTKKKMREANGSSTKGSKPASAPRGSGAPAPDTTMVPTL